MEMRGVPSASKERTTAADVGWVNSHHGTVNSATAGFLQNLLYGQNSNMEVVLDGHSGKGALVLLLHLLNRHSIALTRVAANRKS